MASSSFVSFSGPGPASDDKSQTSLNKKLLEAAKDGDITSVESLLSQGADVNYKNPNYLWLPETPLSAAAEKGHYDIVQLLLSKGADVDSYGGHALVAAARGGHCDIVKLLLSEGADPNAEDWGGGYALYSAAAGGHYDIVQLLLSKGVDAKDEDGSNALIAAARGGHCDIVKLLLSEGADPNAKNEDGGYALVAAARGGHCDIVQLLLSEGADPNAEDAGQDTLSAAAEGGHYDIVQLLLSKGADVNNDEGYALVAAARGGHCDIVKLLLSEGADPNAVDELEGDTALSAAAGQGHYDIVQLLLSKGADVNNGGGYALCLAVGGGHYDIVQLLLSKGVNAKDEDGGYALVAAAREGHCDIVKLLLSEGADPNAKDDEGDTLSAAAEEGHYDIVQLLISKGADVNNDEGYALVVAARGGHCDIVKLLLSEGADPNAKDWRGDTLSAAAEGGHYDIVQLLISKGADVNTDGGDALSAAAEEGHYDIVQLLLSKGANVDIGGGDALIAAAKDGKHNILQLLLSKGVDVNTGEGKALSVAAGGGHYDSVLLLLSKGGASVDSYCQAAIDEAMRNSHNDIVQLLRNHISSSQSHLQQQSFMSKASSSSLPIYSTSLTSSVLQSPSYQYLPIPGVAPQPQLAFNYSPVMQPQPIYPNYYGQPSPYIPQSSFHPQFSYAQPTLLPNTQFTQQFHQGTSGGMHQQFGVQQQLATQYAAPTPFYTERMEYSTLAQPLLSTTESQDPTLPSTSNGMRQDSNTCGNGTAVKERLEELQCYLPQLSNMIERLKHHGPSNELSKLITLYNVIISKNAKISMSTLEKCHIVLRNIFPENSSNDVRDKISTNNTFKEIDQRYLQKAMKDGLVESSVTKAVVQGEARVGKSSLKCLLVSKRYTDDTSTSIIESPCVAVRCFGHTGKYWEEIDEEEMGIKVIAAVQSDAVKKSESNIEEMDLDHANSNNAKKNPSKTTRKVIQQKDGTSDKDGPQNDSSKDNGQSIDTVSDDSSSAAVISHNVPVTIELTSDSNEKNAVVRVRKFYQKCKRNQKKGTSLNGRRWLFFIDSGGQIQFQKLLPAFMPYASVLLLVVSLAKNLSDPASTLMQLPEREINVEQHSLSVIEVLKQLLSAIASSAQQYRSLITEDPLLSKCITPPSDKLQVLPVATHRDEFDESVESIDDKRKQLNEVFKLHSTCDIIGHEGRIFLHEIDGCEAREARLDGRNKLSNPSLEKIVKTLDDSAYQIKVPLKWYCFGVLLYDVAKEGCGVLSLSYCQELGEQLKVGLSPEESLSAIKFLGFLNKLLYYPESPASDLVFVNLESLIDILRDLVIFVSKARSDVTFLLPTHKALVCYGQLSIKILKAASKHCGEISELFPGFEVKLLGLFEYLLIAAKMPDEDCFLMPALLPIKDVSDVNPFPNTIPLLLYFKNNIPMGLFCAVIVHLLSYKESPWMIVEQSNFSNYFTLRHHGFLEGSIILVEQLDCIVLYCEVASDYISARDALEEAIDVAMSKHKLSEKEKPDRAFYCSCPRGKRHAAVATWLQPQHRYISTCTIDYKSQDFSRESMNWMVDNERKRQHDVVQQLPDIFETKLLPSEIAYKVLVDSTQEIKKYFAEDCYEIADKLLQRKVISEKEKNIIIDRNTGLNAYQRMEELLKHVKIAVELKVSVFSLFVQILQEKGTVAAEQFAKKLNERYEQQCCNTDLESSSKRAKYCE